MNNASFVPFDTMPECDRQMDRETDGHLCYSNTIACIACYATALVKIHAFIHNSKAWAFWGPDSLPELNCSWISMVVSQAPYFKPPNLIYWIRPRTPCPRFPLPRFPPLQVWWRCVFHTRVFSRPTTLILCICWSMKTCYFYFKDNFGKHRPISILLSPLQSQSMNCRVRRRKIKISSEEAKGHV